MSNARRSIGLLLLALASSAAAQTHGPEHANKPVEPTPASRPAASQLSQPDALGVLSAVNQAEIGAGKLALQKLASGPVHDYAKRMVDEHGENDAKLQAWSPNRAAAPAQAQKHKGEQELAKLKPLQQDAFAQAYVAAMVKDHAAALDTLDHQLIPSASDAEVRSFLEQTRSHVADHLAAAKKLQAGGGKRAGDARH